MKSEYYVVHQKGTNKYLRASTSQYGTRITLSEMEEAMKFSSVEDARWQAKFYCNRHSSVSMAELEIVHQECTVKDLEAIIALPDKDVLNICVEVQGQGNIVERVKNSLIRKYKAGPITFDLEVAPSCAGEAAYVKNIVWGGPVK